MEFKYDVEEAKKIRETLKECKDEWLESKPNGHGKYLGVNTIRQILDSAAGYWDFTILEQWREEVYKFDKSSRTYNFDGYVYHVKGELYIPLLGRRSQFGSKPAVGGKDNQDSAYKAAASNCLNKCASLFGVGESVYSKIKVDIEEEQQYQQMQQDPNYYMQPAQQQNNVYQMPQQNNVYQMQQQNQMQYQQQQQMQQPIQQTVQQVNQEMAMGNTGTDLPFEQPPVNNQPISYQAEPIQANAQPIQNNAEPVQVSMKPVNVSSEPIQTNNPWNTPEVLRQMQIFESHKQRLGLLKNNDIVPHIRNYFKDEKADMNAITPENLEGFNNYLQTIVSANN